MTNGAIPGKGSLVLRADGQLVRLRECGIVPMSHEPWRTHVWPSAIGYRQDLPAAPHTVYLSWQDGGGNRFGAWVGDQEQEGWEDDAEYLYHGGDPTWQHLDPRPVRFWRTAAEAAYNNLGPMYFRLTRAQVAEALNADMWIARQRFPTEPIDPERKQYLQVSQGWKGRLHWEDSPDTGGWEGRPDTAISIDIPETVVYNGEHVGGDTTVFAGPWLYAPGFTDRIQDADLRDRVRQHLLGNDRPLEIVQLVPDPRGGGVRAPAGQHATYPSDEDMIGRRVQRPMEYEHRAGVVYSHPRSAGRDSLLRRLAGCEVVLMDGRDHDHTLNGQYDYISDGGTARRRTSDRNTSGTRQWDG